ncbi:N-acetylneuraminate synthase [Pseudidiomarina sp.]|uniref:N-acetylneuraminate synthase n=1 Tax=Pseudidiomarina sp. TaxID=2081707 RepID=UPI003A9797C9
MTLIIAEAGVNHNGSADLARDLVRAAHNAGADIVKFQTFKAKNLVTDKATQASYQKKNTGKEESQLAMLQRLELSHDLHFELVEYCNELGIEFLSTAFDDESLDFLVNRLHLKRLKIPSGEITNAPLVLKHAQTGCDLIVSTGMATMAEIEAVLGVIAFGYLNSKESNPTRADFEAAYASDAGQHILREKVSVLHCTTEYPAPMEEINLNAMDTISSTFKLEVGYSDHSHGITIPIAAVAKGAKIIEKHFTLDRNLEGPDHKASLEPSELMAMISAIRDVEIALGDGVKRPTVSEVHNKAIARKSLVAAKPIAKGQQIAAEDIAVKRPGSGRSPFDYWQVIGKSSTQDYLVGDLIVE